MSPHIAGRPHSALECILDSLVKFQKFKEEVA